MVGLVQGRVPERDHGVADVLVDGAARVQDHRGDDAQVAVHEGGEPLGVEAFGQGGEALHVGEKDADGAPLAAEPQVAGFAQEAVDHVVRKVLAEGLAQPGALAAFGFVGQGEPRKRAGQGGGHGSRHGQEDAGRVQGHGRRRRDGHRSGDAGGLAQGMRAGQQGGGGGSRGCQAAENDRGEAGLAQEISGDEVVREGGVHFGARHGGVHRTGDPVHQAGRAQSDEQDHAGKTVARRRGKAGRVDRRSRYRDRAALPFGQGRGEDGSGAPGGERGARAPVSQDPARGFRIRAGRRSDARDAGGCQPERVPGQVSPEDSIRIGLGADRSEGDAGAGVDRAGAIVARQQGPAVGAQGRQESLVVGGPVGRCFGKEDVEGERVCPAAEVGDDAVGFARPGPGKAQRGLRPVQAGLVHVDEADPAARRYGIGAAYLQARFHVVEWAVQCGGQAAQDERQRDRKTCQHGKRPTDEDAAAAIPTTAAAAGCGDSGAFIPACVHRKYVRAIS